MISRRTALALIGGACSLAACAPSSSIIIGSKNFTESILLAEIYAQALRKVGMSVTTRLDLGSTQIAMAAIARGEIDLYPEYTGTALLTVLDLPASQDPAAIYRTVADAFKKQYNLIWLDPAPMNDTQAIATTQAIASHDTLHTLSQLSRMAPELRLATVPEFLTRADGLPGLRKRYGGFMFKEIRTY
ncbi:MAG: glycine betaine ABC transporter substrate-binding protein, partial [Vulcanimicrobiaceae bacterium]